ncbi:MAG TPA: hypothetical protein VNU44_21805 [Bryobacteraceae bacterium]|nr:hypothetical protein [Bryobacteraceae bacterium]
MSDGSGKPIKDARIDHAGRVVVVPRLDMNVPPSPEEIRTDADGHFRATTDSPAIVIRKAGYISQRLLVTGDAQVEVSLQPIKDRSLCRQSSPLDVKRKDASDVDYTATWYYIETKDGSRGVLSGSGPMYSWGAPSFSYVRDSTEYAEVMYESGMIDASGQSKDGKYWRSRSVFGAAARYAGVNREAADLLDCVMERNKLP